jgi:hypothetical protein
VFLYFVLLRWVDAWHEYWEFEMSWQPASYFLRDNFSVQREVSDKEKP